MIPACSDRNAVFLSVPPSSEKWTFVWFLAGGWQIAVCPLLAIGRNRSPSEGAISAARTAPQPPRAPAPPGKKTYPLAKDREVVYFLATGDLTKSIDLNPDDPMPYWHRGQVHSVAGDDDLTKTGFAKAPSRGLKFWI
jgi:hypothetical protein